MEEEEDWGQCNLFWSYIFFKKKSNTGQKNRHEKIIKKIASNPIIILK
jgi:hypothetical protein